MNELRNVFRYDQELGKFYWLITPNSRAKAGDEAGYICSTNGYHGLKYNGKDYLAHRVAWFFVSGTLPVEQIDHINGVRSDNRISNLRECTASQNQKNHCLHKNNTSGHSGVSWSEKRKKFLVAVCVAGKRINIGRFADLSDAIAARKGAEKKFYGDFASAR